LPETDRNKEKRHINGKEWLIIFSVLCSYLETSVPEMIFAILKSGDFPRLRARAGAENNCFTVDKRRFPPFCRVEEVWLNNDNCLEWI